MFLANTACFLASIKNRPLAFTPILTRPSQLTSTRRGSLVIRCMGSVRNDCKDNPWVTGSLSSSDNLVTKAGLDSLRKKEQ